MPIDRVRTWENDNVRFVIAVELDDAVGDDSVEYARGDIIAEVGLG